MREDSDQHHVVITHFLLIPTPVEMGEPFGNAKIVGEVLVVMQQFLFVAFVVLLSLSSNLQVKSFSLQDGKYCLLSLTPKLVVNKRIINLDVKVGMAFMMSWYCLLVTHSS